MVTGLLVELLTENVYPNWRTTAISPEEEPTFHLGETSLHLVH